MNPAPPAPDYTRLELLALEMCAWGYCSGRLEEWPTLLSALRKAGCGLAPTAWVNRDAKPFARSVLGLTFRQTQARVKDSP